MSPRALPPNKEGAARAPSIPGAMPKFIVVGASSRGLLPPNIVGAEVVPKVKEVLGVEVAGCWALPNMKEVVGAWTAGACSGPPNIYDLGTSAPIEGAVEKKN